MRVARPHTHLAGQARGQAPIASASHVDDARMRSGSPNSPTDPSAIESGQRRSPSRSAAVGELIASHVGRHAGRGQEARQQSQPVEVGALGGRRQGGGAQVAGEAGRVGGRVAVGYDRPRRLSEYFAL
jgi:hypothetical protein